MIYLLLIAVSPAYEFAVNEVPLEDVHVEDVEVERVRLNAVQLAICANLGLTLVEVRLSARLAVQLLDVIRPRVEQIAVVCLLVARSEAAKYQDVLV